MFISAMIACDGCKKEFSIQDIHFTGDHGYCVACKPASGKTIMNLPVAFFGTIMECRFKGTELTKPAIMEKVRASEDFFEHFEEDCWHVLDIICEPEYKDLTFDEIHDAISRLQFFSYLPIEEAMEMIQSGKNAPSALSLDLAYKLA